MDGRKRPPEPLPEPRRKFARLEDNIRERGSHSAALIPVTEVQASAKDVLGPHLRLFASTPSLLGLPRELRNMIYDEILQNSISSYLRKANSTTLEELKRSCIRHFSRSDQLHTKIMIGPAYHKDIASLLQVHPKISEEFSETKKVPSHLFLAIHWNADLYGTQWRWKDGGRSTTRNEHAHFVSQDIFSKTWNRVEEPLDTLPKSINPKVCNIDFHYTWDKDPRFEKVGGVLQKLLIPLWVRVAKLAFEEINLRIIVPESRAVQWGSTTGAPDLRYLLAVRRLFSLFSGHSATFTTTVSTSKDVIIASFRQCYKDEDVGWQEISYEHPGWQDGKGWHDGAEYRTCFCDFVEGRVRPVYNTDPVWDFWPPPFPNDLDSEPASLLIKPYWAGFAEVSIAGSDEEWDEYLEHGRNRKKWQDKKIRNIRGDGGQELMVLLGTKKSMEVSGIADLGHDGKAETKRK